MSLRPPGTAPGRPRLLAPTVAIAAVVLLLGGVGVTLYTDLLWFRSVGYSTVFTTELRTKLLLFLGFGLLMALLVGANITVAHRVRPPFRPMSLEQQNLERYRVAVEPFLVPVLLLSSGLFGLFAGLSAASRWQTWLLWRNRTPFGELDPQFGRDVSYYAMTYPFQRFVLGFLLTAVVLSLLAAAATHYLFGGVRLQTVGDKVSPAARAHLSVLVGLVLLLKAYAYYLDRFGLVFSERGRVQGASFTDLNAVLPAKNVLIGVAIICALLAFANIVVRNILLPAGAVALLVVTAVVFGGVYPAYTQQFRVKPNEIEREAEFIGRNIEATRKAYRIDDVQTQPYDPRNETTTAALQRDAGTVSNVRVLDPTVLPATFRQFQRLRGYFGFNTDSVDIDRYNLGEGLQDYVVAVRELRLAGLDASQRNWINEHLIYTHGNGFVAAPANTANGGVPEFVVGGLPVEGPLNIDESRIYFGEFTTDYSVVNTRQEETDGPIDGSDAPTYNYTGKGGVELSDPLRKVAYALKFREKNLLLSGALNDRSRLMYDRTPRERVQKVAPFLQLDADPYPAVVRGRIVWIVDGYTTSAGYPYAERTVLGEAVQDSQTTTGPRLPPDRVNYIRNSVKATVDAFSGEVKLYAFDEQDPVLRTWDKAFGGILEPASAISKELRDHFRYPEDLFKVQRELLAKYHIESPLEFFQGDDYWQIPADPASQSETAEDGGNGARPQQQQQPGGQQAPNLFNTVGRGPDQPPYYVLSQFPGQDQPSFNLTSSFVARSAPNLTAVAAVSSNADDYGTLRVLEVPDTRQIDGPGQVAGAFQTNGAVRQVLFALNQQGSARIIPGNLLTLPVGGGLLYVEPIYVQAQQGEPYPTLQYVIAQFGSEIVIERTLGEALESLFGAGARTLVPPATPGDPSPTPTGQPQPPGAGAGGPEVQAAIRDAQAAFQQG
ncbi:MAG: UPF0182 family protein, partial [Actinomycetota bacterium]|nr:UPF0182 family protein [Actinomycetota bacterium]